MANLKLVRTGREHCVSIEFRGDPPHSKTLSRQDKLGASCRVRVPAGKGLALPFTHKYC